MRVIEIPYVSDQDMAKLSGRLMAGRGSFKIINVSEGQAKSSGNHQIKIEFQIWDSYGNEGTAADYFPLIESCAWKIKSFMISIGEKYEKGCKLDLDLISGKTGSCNLKGEKYTGSDGIQKESIKIGSYLASSKNDASVPEVKKVSGDDVIDDDIPF